MKFEIKAFLFSVMHCNATVTHIRLRVSAYTCIKSVYRTGIKCVMVTHMPLRMYVIGYAVLHFILLRRHSFDRVSRWDVVHDGKEGRIPLSLCTWLRRYWLYSPVSAMRVRGAIDVITQCQFPPIAAVTWFHGMKLVGTWGIWSVTPAHYALDCAIANHTGERPPISWKRPTRCPLAPRYLDAADREVTP